jgi:hypothetical protein
MTTLWPDYMKRETLAKRLDLAPGAIDQLVKRGLLPGPIQIGEARLWCWDDVQARLATRGVLVEAPSDPYDAGARRVSEIAPTRRDGPQQHGTAVPVPAQTSRNGTG